MIPDDEPAPEKNGKRPPVRVISPGLVNLGNTCFANSTLQVLAASEPLHNVLSSTNEAPPPEGTLTTPFVHLMRKIYRSQSQQALNPKELYNTFVKKYTYFKPYTQQDAHEFLRFLLEGLKSEAPTPAPDTVARPTMKRTRRRTLVSAGTEDIESPPGNSSSETPATYIDQLFGGKLASYVVCDVCKSVSTSYEDYQDISLPIHEADSPHLRKRDRFRAQFLRPTFNPFNSHKYSLSTPNVQNSDQEDGGGMASDVGGYMSSGGQPESGHHSERRSFDEGDRKKVALGRKFAKLSLEDKSSPDSSLSAPPLALRLEPWGHIPDPPKERHEYIKKLLGEVQEGHRLSRLLGGDTSHHHHHTRASSPSASPLSRSSSLSRTLSRIGSEKPVAKTSLTDCFKRFTNVEVLDGDNKFACEECAKFLYPKRATGGEDDSTSDDDVSMASPDTITTPVAPVRKARRRTLTLERQESRGRTRTRVKTPDAEAESETSGAELDDESMSISIDSSKSSLPTSEAPIVKIPSVPRLAVSEESSTSPTTLERKISIPRSSISSAPPRYILRKAFKRIKLQSPLPPVMILHLKRFYGTYTGSMKKIDDFVSFETEFDFSPYVFPPSIKKSKLMYSLTGVVIHLGSINSGHYVSYFLTHKTLPALPEDKPKKKDRPVSSDGEYLSREEPGQGRREWVYASDTSVRAASIEEVLRARAYLLIYEKKP